MGVSILTWSSDVMHDGNLMGALSALLASECYVHSHIDPAVPVMVKDLTRALALPCFEVVESPYESGHAADKNMWPSLQRQT